ncbi:hypothetical protein PYCC9005_005523 [Savitreella phatthalungensis]
MDDELRYDQDIAQGLYDAGLEFARTMSLVRHAKWAGSGRQRPTDDAQKEQIDPPRPQVYPQVRVHQPPPDTVVVPRAPRSRAFVPDSTPAVTSPESERDSAEWVYVPQERSARRAFHPVVQMTTTRGDELHHGVPPPTPQMEMDTDTATVSWQPEVSAGAVVEMGFESEETGLTGNDDVDIGEEKEGEKRSRPADLPSPERKRQKTTADQRTDHFERTDHVDDDESFWRAAARVDDERAFMP